MNRNTAVIAGAALLAALIGARILITPRPAPPVVLPLPQPVATAAAPIAPAPAPKPVVPPAVAPKPPPPLPGLPALPQKEIAALPEHEVPDQPPPFEGRKLDLRGFDAAADATAPPRAAPRYFSGPARITGGTSLEIGHIPVVLFGIRTPPAGMSCADGLGCETAERAALRSRIGTGKVSCRSPVPNQGVVAFAICLSAEGIDLGGALIDGGLALADTGQSYDYVGAESIARTLRRGLWRFR